MVIDRQIFTECRIGNLLAGNDKFLFNCKEQDTGFPLTERDRLGLRGLLPPRIISFEQQYARFSKPVIYLFQLSLPAFLFKAISIYCAQEHAGTQQQGKNERALLDELGQALFPWRKN